MNKLISFMRCSQYMFFITLFLLSYHWRTRKPVFGHFILGLFGCTFILGAFKKSSSPEGTWNVGWCASIRLTWCAWCSLDLAGIYCLAYDLKAVEVNVKGPVVFEWDPHVALRTHATTQFFRITGRDNPEVRVLCRGRNANLKKIIQASGKHLGNNVL